MAYSTPTLGHYRRDSLNHQMLIIVFNFDFDLKIIRSFVARLGIPVECSAVLEATIFWFYCNALTHFMPLISFYTPWKHKKTRFSDVFREYRKRPVAWNGLTHWTTLNWALRLNITLVLNFTLHKIQRREVSWSIVYIIFLPSRQILRNLVLMLRGYILPLIKLLRI